MKKRIQQIDKNLDAIVKNPYEKEHIVEKKESRFPLWAKWAIPFGSVALACSLTLAIVLPTAKGNADPGRNEASAAKGASTAKEYSDNYEPMLGDDSQAAASGQGGRSPIDKDIPLENYSMLAPSTVNKYSDTPHTTLSQTTYNSYTSFAKKFTKLMMQIGSANGEKSLGVSIPDAYLCFAISGIISSPAACNDVLSYLGLSSIEDLKTASREIISTLGTLSKSSQDKYVGGYNLNSIWVDPDQIGLLEGEEKDEDLYEDLAGVYDVSLINEAFKDAKANKYLKDNAPQGFPSPEVKLDRDDNPPAMAVMSAFYFMDLLRDTEIYQNQYESGTHLKNYTFNGMSKSVNYIDYVDYSGQYYTGDGFHAAAIDMWQSSIYFYLPDSQTAMPSTILDKVLNRNYVAETVTGQDGREYSWYRVEVNAPYFKMDNEIELKEEPLQEILPVITSDGMGSRLLNDSLFLSGIYQFSTMSFDYRGFYSASVTIATGDAAAVGSPDFTLDVDHPFIFETRKDVTVAGDNLTVPVVIGEVVDPAYPAYQAS
ncbi:MAG: hypothetical protein IKX82_00485 [Bacilli bacterium]|nr:hypothetical protein [Bacilli bacterium]